MSNNVNTELLEYTAMLIDKFGEQSEYSQQLEKAIDSNDLEELANLVRAQYLYCELCGKMMTANCNNAACDKGGVR